MDGSSRPRAPMPPPPDRQFSFTGWQVANPTAPPPGDKLDAEFDRTNTAVEDVINWVSTSLNTDGSLVEPPVGEPSPATSAVALAEDWADVSTAWAEHMPDTIPPNILATMAITGDHWSARWWANRAAQIVSGEIPPDSEPSAAPPIFSVKNWLAPDQPDGATDNSLGIQAAIDAAAAAVDSSHRGQAPGAFVLVFPAAPKNYVAAGLMVPSNSHLIINAGAVLWLQNSANTSMFTLASGATNVTIEGQGTLAGNAGGQTGSGTSAGIGNAGACSNVVVRGININNFKNWPVNLLACTNGLVRNVTMDGNGNSAEFAYQGNNCWFDACTVSNCADLAIGLYGGLTNSGVVDCVAYNSSSGPFILADASQGAPCSNCCIRGCVSYNNAVNGIAVVNSFSPSSFHTDISVQNNHCYGNAHSGLFFQNVIDLLVSGNTCSKNSSNVNSAGDVVFYTTVGGCHMTGNYIYNTQYGFGVYLFSPNYISIVGNRFEDDQTTPTMTGAVGGTAGSRCIIQGNVYGTFVGTAEQFTPSGDSFSAMNFDSHNEYMVGGGYSNVGQVTLANQAVTPVPSRGLTPGWNLSGGRGEVNFLCGQGPGSTPGGFDFSQVNAAGTINPNVGFAGSLLANDGYGNTRIGGARCHGNIQTTTLDSGGTLTLNPNVDLVFINNTTSIAAATLILPTPTPHSFMDSTNPIYGTTNSDLEINFRGAVGALTITAPSGYAVINPPTAAATSASVLFLLNGSTWIRRIMS